MSWFMYIYNNKTTKCNPIHLISSIILWVVFLLVILFSSCKTIHADNENKCNTSSSTISMTGLVIGTAGAILNAILPPPFNSISAFILGACGVDMFSNPSRYNK